MDRTDPAFSCPLPLSRYGSVVLGHGSGGRLTADLVREVFLPAFGNPTLASQEDQASVELDLRGGRLALTTDAFVVRPIEFPGGDIGRLAINGTVNDLYVGGAEPRYLSAAFILEEGLSFDELRRIAASMSAACAESRVTLVTADTKVVDRGKGDKIFITTTGVGIVPAGRSLSIAGARPGDAILVSGPIGDHGVAILSVREGLEFETAIESDTAPLGELTRAALAASTRVRCMRDPTRGGLAGTLNELALGSRCGVEIDEMAIPIREPVRAACELLGLDPLYVANEGKLVVVVENTDAERVLEALRGAARGSGAAIIGRVVDGAAGIVTARGASRGERVVPLLAGEALPRIC